MPEEEKKVKEEVKEAEELRKPASKELTREQLEALRRKLQKKFH